VASGRRRRRKLLKTPAPDPLEADLVSADVVVIGSGITGLVFALEVASEASVVVITKKAEADSNTNYARGGIAAVLGPDDDPSLHVRDTLEAGAGLCRRDVVEGVVREGPERIRNLVEWGVRFNRGEGGLDLGREGGHSRRRIVHAEDRTGREVERALLAAVSRAGVRILEDHLAVELIVEPGEGGRGARCVGVEALDHEGNRRVVFQAPYVLLAAGGCGQVYRHTTNPRIATGDGVAMAHRAGARIGNMEFVQFHPTALFPTEDPAFLISEALRGEGAVLRRRDGESFMEGYDPRGSLAPRDVVARAADREMKRTGDDHVILDVSPIPPKELERRFPGAAEGCRARGIDPYEGIPVVPAAHYACGGVRSDAEGRTSLPGLLAAGEVACTGMHGANRLASNSLLEAVVFAHRTARVVLEDRGVESRGRGAPGGADASGGGDPFPGGTAHPFPEDGGRGPGESRIETAEREARGAKGEETESVRIAALRARVRDLMWENVGIVRSDEELERAVGILAALLEEEEARWAKGPWTLERAELRNLLRTAWLVAACARARKESRGLHYNVDHPGRDDERYRKDTLVG